MEKESGIVENGENCENEGLPGKTVHFIFKLAFKEKPRIEQRESAVDVKGK